MYIMLLKSREDVTSFWNPFNGRFVLYTTYKTIPLIVNFKACDACLAILVEIMEGGGKLDKGPDQK